MNNQVKKVLLSGGTAGIGRAISLLLAEKGYQVYLFGRNAQKIKDLRKDAQLRNVEDKLTMIPLDMTDRKDFERKMREWVDEEGPFHVLVNNAAIGFGGVEGIGFTELEDLMTINLTSYMWMAGLLAAHMKSHKIEGDIIQIGSMSAHSRDGGSSAYVATKSGIQGFSEALRKELRPDKIRVTHIEPGMVGSDMHDMDTEEERKRQEALTLLKAEDIAEIVVYALDCDRRVNLCEIKVKPLCQEE